MIIHEPDNLKEYSWVGKSNVQDFVKKVNFWVMWIMSITKQVFNFSTLYIVAFNQYWHWSCEILLMHVHGLYKSVHTVHVGGDFNRKLLGFV